MYDCQSRSMPSVSSLNPFLACRGNCVAQTRYYAQSMVIDFLAKVSAIPVSAPLLQGAELGSLTLIQK